MRVFPLVGLLFSVCLMATRLLAQTASSAGAAAAGAGEILQLEPLKIGGSGLGAGETAGVEPTNLYDAQDLEEAGVFNLEEFFERLPESPAGTEQLVLIDGQPTYIDIRTLPPEMIASIEVSNLGALPQYGAYADGRVINIRLKPNYVGGSVTYEGKGAFAGGGFRTGVSLNASLTRNKWRYLFALEYREQAALFAADRPFSREQDHTARGGRDLRLLWGETAVVQARDGNLPGVVDANGQPTSVALVPENQSGQGLSPGDFLGPRVFAPATEGTAAGQRRFNTSEFVTLIAPAEERSFTFSVTGPFVGKIEATISGGVNSRVATRGLAPPVTAVSSRTVVPAAYNPFGTEVAIGMVHTGFGPVRQQDEGDAYQLGFALNGRWSDTWRWNGTLGGKWNRTRQDVIDLDRDKFGAALAATDPAQRFNPFGDDPQNAALYREMEARRSSRAQADDIELDLSVNGEVRQLEGGAMRLIARGNYDEQTRIKRYENSGELARDETNRRDNRQGTHVTVIVPWIGQANARPGVRRFENHLMGGYALRSGAPGENLSARFGALWSPHPALSFNTSYSRQRRAPSRFVADLQPLVGETFVDPRRFPSTATDVELLARDFDGAVGAQSEQVQASMTVEPPFLKGLQMMLSYDRQEQEDLTSAVFKPQDLIYNELTFPGRVERAAPTEDDLLLGQPGRIVRIDTTPTDGAARESSGMAMTMRYRRPDTAAGSFNIMASVRHPLSRRYEVVPGVPFVFESSNQLNPPDWTLTSRFSWSRKNWSATVGYRLVDRVVSGSLVQASVSQLSLEAGYRFTKPWLGGWGRGTQVRLEFGDLLRGAPPFADTINGFRSGSPLGRTYELTLRVPFGDGAKGGGGAQGRGRARG